MSLLERIYYFHEELKKDRFPNTTTLMGQFEVSLATARRDISYLRDRLLAPISFDQIKNGFFYTEHGFSLPFENNPKILFLLGMISKIADEAGLGTLPEIKSLERKLAELVTPDYNTLVDAIYCEWVEVESLQPEIFEEIIEAIVKKRILEISYRSAQAEKSMRSLEPLRLINYQGRWYLLAFCRLRQALRLFHLARIHHAEMSNIHFRRQSDDNFESYLNATFGIFKGEVRYTATILFTSTAAELVRHQHWHKDQHIEKTDDGILLHLPVSDDREILGKILQYGAMAKVIGPSELRQRIHDEIKKISEVYN